MTLPRLVVSVYENQERVTMCGARTNRSTRGEIKSKMLSRINLSAAIIVLVCFFLPWVQVSCAGAKDTLSGLDLARQDDALLWLVPLLLCAVLVFVLLRMRAARPQLLGVLSTACGLIVVVLMNRERMRAHDESGLI